MCGTDILKKKKLYMSLFIAWKTVRIYMKGNGWFEKRVVLILKEMVSNKRR